MNVEIKVTDSALPMLKGAEKQLPFAMARALTWVAEDVKFKMAEQVGQVFTVRDPWVKSPGRWEVTPARKQDHPNQVSRVDLDTQAGFLADFETGKVRFPGDRAYDRIAAAHNEIYLPTKAIRPAFGGSVPQALRPKNIGISLRMTPSGGFQLTGQGKKSRKSAKAAAQRFFRMRPAVQHGKAAGIWERTGSGAGLPRGNDNLRFVWKALPSVRIPKRLRTIEWARAEIMKQWPDKMERSWALALAPAR